MHFVGENQLLVLHVTTLQGLHQIDGLAERDVAVVVSVDERYRVAADSSLEWARSVAATLQLPSLSLAASVDGQLVWQAVMGYRDLDDLEEVSDFATLPVRYRVEGVASSRSSRSR